MADAGGFERERLRFDVRQGIGEIARRAAIDLAAERQRQVQLVVVLPAGPVDAAGGIEQGLTDGRRRPDGDEEPAKSYQMCTRFSGAM